MTRDCKWSERSKVSSVLERYQAEGDDDQQNCLLMDMPTEKERRVSA